MSPTRRSAQFATDFRIYAALGNHDWRTSREGAMAQVRYLEKTRPFYMDGIRYRVAPTGDPREVEIFVLDTHVMLSGVHRARGRARRRRQRSCTRKKIDPPPRLGRCRSTDVERRMAEWLEEEPRAIRRRAGRS